MSGLSQGKAEFLCAAAFWSLGRSTEVGIKALWINRDMERHLKGGSTARLGRTSGSVLLCYLPGLRKEDLGRRRKEGEWIRMVSGAKGAASSGRFIFIFLLVAFELPPFM